MPACLADDTVAELVEGRLDDASLERATAHLDECPSCRRLVAEVARASGDGGEAPLAPGMMLGRYVVLDVVGAGAMGVVCAAHDPELGRKVALKVLRDAGESGGAGEAGEAGEEASERRARLLREAQAVARLSHPNVVTLHDVGTVGGRVFLAMELLEGGTLRAWLRAERRTTSEIVRVFRQAGEGLSAAHEKGIVHRDFKPDNVLLGADGRARVSDFGLARAEGDLEGDPGAARLAARLVQSSPMYATITRTGAMVGTPAYMAPEQRAGRRADARSDVYAFSVALHEALFEARPGAPPSRTPPPRAVPGWLRKVVERGLRASPDERYPTMRALLDDLDRGAARGPRGLLALAGAVALAALAALGLAARRGPEVCTGGEGLFGAWDDARRGEVRAAFERASPAIGAATFERVDGALDRYRRAWGEARDEACRATRVRGEQPEATLEQRLRCLDDRRREAAGLVRLFAEADPKGVERAVQAAQSLPPPSACSEAAALAEAPRPSDPAARARWDEIDAAVAETRAAVLAGRPERGRRVAEAARAAGHASGAARALVLAAKAEENAGRFDDAVASLDEAAALALSSRDDATAVDAWSALIGVTGFRMGRVGEAERWSRYAEAALDRLGGDDLREAEWRLNVASVRWYVEARLGEARGLAERARALFEKARGPDYYRLASCDDVLGGVLLDEGRFDDALLAHQRSYALRERVLGPRHGSTLVARSNVAETLSDLGRNDEALALYQDILRDMDTGYMRMHLAEVLRRGNQPELALAEDRRSVAMYDQAGGEDHDLHLPLLGLGEDLLALGRPGEALAPLERALPVAERGSPVPLARVRFALARALWEGGGDRARARSLAGEALATLRSYGERYGSVYAGERDLVVAWLAARAER